MNFCVILQIIIILEGIFKFRELLNTVILKGRQIECQNF